MGGTSSESDAERIELARAIVTSLPKFGAWASTSRQFHTPYGQLGYRRISILWVLRHGMLPKKDTTATGLAQFFRVQPSVITRALASLESDGFISRSIDSVPAERLAPLQESVRELDCVADELDRRRWGRSNRAARDAETTKQSE